MTPSAPHRAAAKWIAITSAVVALGCPPPGHSPYPRPDWSTPLPTGVDSVASTFRTRVDTGFLRGATSHTRARASSSCPVCIVEVKIEPLGDTRLIDPDNAPAAGTAVARIENLDSSDVEAKFGFRPGIQAVYYLWVDRKPRSTKARWTILQVPMGAGIVTAGYQRDLKRCMYAHEGEIRISDADFYEYKYGDHRCEITASADKSSTYEASFLSTENFVVLVEHVAAFVRGKFSAAQGGWISCSAGCCT